MAAPWPYTRDLADLFRLYTDRRAEGAGRMGTWGDLALVYDGENVTRIAELDKVAASAVPNLVNQGIDGYTRLFASLLPSVRCPAVRDNIASSRRRAADRAAVITGWWQASGMSVAQYQRGRYHFGYGASPAVIRPHPTQPALPRWEVRNPIGVLPGPRDLDYSPAIPDCFVSISRSARWVSQNYGVDFGTTCHPDMLVEVVEYNDPEQMTLFCVGPAGGPGSSPTWSTNLPSSLTYTAGWNYGSEIRQRRIERISGPGVAGGWLIELSSTPNYAGTCTVSYPGAISMSKVQGLVNGILAKHHLHAQLVALTMEATGRGVFPNEWVVLNQGGRVVKTADGLKGIVGEIEDGQVVLNQIQPGYQTFQMIDRLEGWQRSEAGIVSQFGGTNPTNIRTGAASATSMAAAVDPVVREAHEIMQVALEHENRIAVAWAKGYGGSRTFSTYVSDGRQKRKAEYVPNELFETDETDVRYSVAGADMNGLVIAVSQSQGTEQLSKRSARELNPLVRDPEHEERQIMLEAATQVALGGLVSLMERQPEDVAYIIGRIRAGDDIEDIIDGANKRAQQRQASAGAVGEPDGPVLPGEPEAQPGIGLPEGGGQVPVAVDQPAPALRNLASLFTSSRRPAMTVPAERAG